jgi:hypothetical protein
MQVLGKDEFLYLVWVFTMILLQELRIFERDPIVMNLLTIAFLAFATIVATSPTNILAHEKRARYPSVSGLKFNIGGNVTYFAGTNSYWISFLTNDGDVDLVMSHLKTANLKVLRVWGNTNLQQIFPASYIWGGMKNSTH